MGRRLTLAVLGAAALALTACPRQGPQPSASGSGERLPRAPLDGQAFPEPYRAAVAAVAASLKEEREDPAEFSCDLEVPADGQELVFHLWHRSAFLPENVGALGNPGGKCRDVWYDRRQQKVIKTLFWQ